MFSDDSELAILKVLGYGATKFFQKNSDYKKNKELTKCNLIY